MAAPADAVSRGSQDAVKGFVHAVNSGDSDGCLTQTSSPVSLGVCLSAAYSHISVELRTLGA